MGDNGSQDVIPTDDYFAPPPPDSSPPPPEAEISSPPPPTEDPSPPPPLPPIEDPSPSPPPPGEETSSAPPPPDEKNPSPSPPPPPAEETIPSPVTVPSASDSPPPPPIWVAPAVNGSTPSPPVNASVSPTPVGSLPPPPVSVAAASSNSASSISGILVGGLLCGILVLAMVIALVMCCLKKKKRRQYYMDPPPPKQGDYYNNWNSTPPNDHIVKLQPQPSWGSPATGHLSNEFMIPTPSASPMNIGHNQSSFSYDQLAVATSEFSQANLLGQGGFGFVHKGVLASGKEVAVKSLKSGSGQGEREFQAEVEMLSRVHHRHLVSLVGYCIYGDKRMLVYEFVPNKTLEFHLHGKGQPVMDWETRMRIALGSSKGLGYLHEDCHPKIIHRDIKAANILLDNNFEAMVADFGLAKLSSDNNTHVSTRVMGTFGYLAPEYASSGKLTDKSDVFSFGVMLLELITGRKPVDASNYMEDSLVDWARPLLSRALEDGNYSGLVDPLLENDYDNDEMARMVACAAASIRHSAKRRPKMTQIVRALEGDVSLDDLIDGPKPVHNSISRSNLSSSDTGLYDTGAYNADMMKFRKMVMANETVASSEYSATSEYGLNPSPSSSDSSDYSSMHKDKI